MKLRLNVIIFVLILVLYVNSQKSLSVFDIIDSGESKPILTYIEKSPAQSDAYRFAQSNSPVAHTQPSLISSQTPAMITVIT